MSENPILDDPSIRRDLAELLNPVHAAYKTLINPQADTDHLFDAIDRAVAGIASDGTTGYQTALAIQAHLGTLYGSSAFWGRPLGRALAWYGFAPADPDGNVSPSVVAAVLGMSRQRASEVQRGGGRLRTPRLLAAELRRRHTDAQSG